MHNIIMVMVQVVTLLPLSVLISNQRLIVIRLDLPNSVLVSSTLPFEIFPFVVSVREPDLI